MSLNGTSCAQEPGSSRSPGLGDRAVSADDTSATGVCGALVERASLSAAKTRCSGMPPPKIKESAFSADVVEFIRLLQRFGVRCLVVEGEAVIFHGYPRLTGAIDLFY